MDERVLVMSGFYAVRLPDGRRLLEMPPVGQIVEGPNPGPFGVRVGNSPTFRVKNLGDGRYVLQYGADQIPIVLYYQSNLEGLALNSFEGPFVNDVGLVPVGSNTGAYATLYPPTAAQPETALPGYANPPSIQERTQQAVAERTALEELTRQRAEAGIVQDFTPPELRNPVDPLAPPRPGAISTVQPFAPVSTNQPSTDVYYMTSAPGGAVVDTTRGGSTPMPSGISPVAVAGAMVLLFLLGDEGK